MEFDDILKKVKATLTDPTTSSDIVQVLQDQNNLLARLVANAEFDKSETDQIHIVPFHLEKMMPDKAATFNDVIVPAKPGYEIHVYDWSISLDPNTSTAMVFSMHTGDYAKDNDRIMAQSSFHTYLL